MSPLAIFRRAARAEALTWALLLVGMVVKHGLGLTDVLVRVFGMLHGVVFLAYCVVAVFVWVNQRWLPRTGLLALAAAVPPFATVWFERWAQRRGDLYGGWRLAPGAEQPRGPVEAAQAWMLRRPGAAVALGAVAVAAVTVLALWAGPPLPSSG
jgi:integral membrane protein